MSTIEKHEIQSLISQLNASISSSTIDLRTIYKVHGYLLSIGSPASIRASSLLDIYDTAANRNDNKAAVAYAERMVGLLEGIDRSVDYPAPPPPLRIETDIEIQPPLFILDGDERKMVLRLASEMRKSVVSSDFFDRAHKVRLIKRISAIEAEVHKPKGMFDVILGGISDVGEAFGKFGTDVKPLVERMEEIRKITRSKSAEYDQLPAPDEIKRLPAPNSGDEE